MNYWDNYYKRPLDTIPWQRTQADWLKHSVDDGVIKGNAALDLGCGTGMKSIYLAQHGFNKVVAVDISKLAIKHAKKNAKDASVADKCSFLAGDIRDLSILGQQKFDFILDWAVLHCLPISDWPKYLEQVLTHSKAGTLFMLRVFSNIGVDKDHFIDEIEGQKSRVHLFGRGEIEGLFGDDFKTIKSNTSQPRTQDHLRFLEYLMKKK